MNVMSHKQLHELAQKAYDRESLLTDLKNLPKETPIWLVIEYFDTKCRVQIMNGQRRIKAMEFVRQEIQDGIDKLTEELSKLRMETEPEPTRE